MLNLLVIRACAIGDFVLNLPALASFQESHSDVRFTLVGYPQTLEIARDFVHVARICSIEAMPWSRLFFEPVYELDFDQAVVWMKDPLLAENLRASGIRDVVRLDPFAVTGHASEHLLASLGLKRPELPDMWRPATDRVILHPGSGSVKKRWPYFRELAERLGSVAFLIGPTESDFDTTGYPRLENLSLPEVTRLLVASRGYVGNDSGITHLAAYLGCPTVAVFGPTDLSIWRPLGRRVLVLWKPELKDITIAEVIAYCSFFPGGVTNFGE